MSKHQFIIIGSGFGGLLAAINLRKRGLDDFVILERRPFAGGTWLQNTYPGAQVDVHSPLYSLSMEQWPWTRMFAEQEELAEYTNAVIDKHGLRERIQLNTEVCKVQWEDGEWQVDCKDGVNYTSQFLINASGPLSTPVIPEFEGLADFHGRAFHTNQWEHDFNYKGKRVAMIGSGASAIQVGPAIAESVGKLYVFQRNPHWVLPRPDKEFSSFESSLLKIPFIYNLLRAFIYWSNEFRVVGFKYSKFMLKLVAGNKALKHIRKQVADPELRKKLTPDYIIGCKRVLLSNTWYPSLQRENVRLLDKENGIERFTTKGIRTVKGEEIELDAVVFATGFDATDGLISYPVHGQDGVVLQERWSEVPSAYLGTTIPGFPNFFVVTGPNTGIGHTSAIWVIEAQMEYIMRCISETIKRSSGSIEVEEAAERDYSAMIRREMADTVWQTGGCNSWYKSRSGQVVAMFPGFTFSYRRLARKFRAADHIFGTANDSE